MTLIMSPSPFVVEWTSRLARDRVTRGLALDIAMGRGRHTLALARAGWRTFGVDIRFGALREGVSAAAAEELSVAAWCADLTAHPLPAARFNLIVVTRYLQRDLFSALRRAVVPGGFIVYETFTTWQRTLGTGPTSADHLLEPGELRQLFEGFDVSFYEEVAAPEAVARIVARRP
ncbi:MAG: class I SAM-dependent methyltransferase [Gemmatimonadales bacterium]